MEQTKLPVVAKRMWNIVRVIFYMLRKGIIKKKIMVDLNMMVTRGKIAGKAIQNLISRHAHHSIPHLFGGHASSPSREHELGRGNAPAWFHVGKRKHKQHALFFPCAHAPAADDDAAAVNAVRRALEMLNDDVSASPAIWYSAASSPAALEFGRSPAPARQVRITDSPFPMHGIDENSHVDKAAAEFIARFYRELNKQNQITFR